MRNTLAGAVYAALWVRVTFRLSVGGELGTEWAKGGGFLLPKAPKRNHLTMCVMRKLFNDVFFVQKLAVLFLFFYPRKCSKNSHHPLTMSPDNEDTSIMGPPPLPVRCPQNTFVQQGRHSLDICPSSPGSYVEGKSPLDPPQLHPTNLSAGFCIEADHPPRGGVTPMHP